MFLFAGSCHSSGRSSLAMYKSAGPQRLLIPLETSFCKQYFWSVNWYHPTSISLCSHQFCSVVCLLALQPLEHAVGHGHTKSTSNSNRLLCFSWGSIKMNLWDTRRLPFQLHCSAAGVLLLVVWNAVYHSWPGVKWCPAKEVDRGAVGGDKG